MTAPTEPPAPTTRRTSRPPGPVDRRDEVVDASATFVLAVLALLVLLRPFGGLAAVVIGAFGAAAGTAVGMLTAHLRWSPLRTVVTAALGFVAFASVAVPDDAIAGVLPSPAVPAAVLSGLVNAWAGALTTPPPLGVSEGLGLIPYVLGFGAGLGGALLARRTELALVPAVPAMVALVGGSVFGTSLASSVLLTGGALVGVALGWGSLRAGRARRGTTAPPVSRAVAGVVMLVLVVLVATLAGPHLLFVDADDRWVPREEVEPPFDTLAEPSPMGAFRRYLDRDLNEQVLFSVELPAGADRVRLATMDRYDGVVWVAGDGGGSASGRFERVGASVDPEPPGTPATARIHIQDKPSDLWMPTVGLLHSVRFEGDRAEALASDYRYNPTTGTAAVPRRLDVGDGYELDVRLAPTRDDTGWSGRKPASLRQPELVALPETVTKRAAQATSGKKTPYDQAVGLEGWLHSKGFFSDGGADTRNTAAASAPGHSLARIAALLEDDSQMVGNAEQYATAMALLARTIGLPARVVMGFKPDGAGPGPVDVRGRDVYAWVEVAFDEVGWVAFDPTPPEDQQPKPKPQEEPIEEQLAQQPPPPERAFDPPDSIPERSTERPDQPEEGTAEEQGELPVVVRVLLVLVVALLVPFLVALAWTGAIVAAKALRARRRRSRGGPVRRLHGAWLEASDRARDLGGSYPPRATRAEAAVALSDVWPGAPAFAQEMDGAMFSEHDPDEATVAGAWDAVKRARVDMGEGLDRRQRWRAAVRLTSLRRPRVPRPVPPPAADGPSGSALASDEAAGVGGKAVE